MVHSVCIEHSVRRYDFAGRELAECYTRSAGFKCPGCGKTVMRSKVPMELGAGRRHVAFQLPLLIAVNSTSPMLAKFALIVGLGSVMC